MHSIYTQLKALMLLLIIVFGVALYENIDTLSFLMHTKGASMTATVLGSLDNFLGVTTLQTPKGSTASSLSSTPDMVCLPGIVDGKEEVIVEWACTDNSSYTKSTNFETGGAVSGTVRLKPSATSVYGVECYGAQSAKPKSVASCMVQVAPNTADIHIAPNNPSVGDTVSVIWNAKNAQNCTLTSDTDAGFKRSGTAGEASYTLNSIPTTFSLQCDTITGMQHTYTKEIAL